MQDCQLIVAGNKGDQLILICNNSYMPVQLQRRPVSMMNRNDENKIYFENTYGTGLHLTATEHPHVIIMEGKNLHYFRALPPGRGKANQLGPGFLEFWPSGPHEVKQMQFKEREHHSIIASPNPEPIPAYKTLGGEKVGRKMLTDRDSGSACCIPIKWKDGGTIYNSDGANRPKQRPLLLGFSHRKTRKGAGPSVQYTYVSRVYAFEPYPPFAIVALSGFFCLGYAPHQGTSIVDVGLLNVTSKADDEAIQSDNEQIWGAVNDHKMKLHGEQYDCPRIHFVSGIAEKFGDAGTVIISYGVNDCYPRMLEVSKKFLVGLLMPVT